MNEKLSLDELAKRLDEAALLVTVGASYKHYKNNMYVVTGLAIDEKTDTVSVIYKALYDSRLTFIRPVASWVEDVNLDNKTVKRFIKSDTL